MRTTIFLYLDILGFRDLMQRPERVDWLFQRLDAARIHSDSNYHATVFSDTLIAYNRRELQSAEAKSIEVIFLIELVQQFTSLIVGSGIFYKAVVTEGNFSYTKLRNIEAYYGDALLGAYDNESKINATGLYLDKSLRQYNQIFRWREYSDTLDFVYFTQRLSEIEGWTRDCTNGNLSMKGATLPLDLTLIGEYDELGIRVIEEVEHLREVFTAMNEHPKDSVRRKYSNTWIFYQKQYPAVTGALTASNFDPASLVRFEWATVIEQFLAIRSDWPKP